MAAVGVMSFIWKTFFIGDGGRGGVSRGGVFDWREVISSTWVGVLLQ